MQSASLPVRQPRNRYRHELRTLTYVTLDGANGGIIRNLNRAGVAVQAVSPLRKEQRVRMRFELRHPRVRLDVYGSVIWANSSGQCGIRFVDLPERTGHQVNEWIFSHLLEAAARVADDEQLTYREVRRSAVRDRTASAETNALTFSCSARPAIRLDYGRAGAPAEAEPYLGNEDADREVQKRAELNWFLRPVSGRTMTRLVDGLVMFAALLLFIFIFLLIAHELPPWPLAVTGGVIAATSIVACYRALFVLMGGPTLGARLALASHDGDEK